MREKWADADHLRFKFMDKLQVFCQMFRCLKRRTDHKTGSGLITDRFQISEALNPVFTPKTHWVKFSIVFRVSCFVTQKIAVSSGIKPFLISRLFPFAYRQRNSTVRIGTADRSNNVRHGMICIRHIFTALKDKSPKPQIIADTAAFQNS